MALTPEEEEKIWKVLFGNGETGVVEDVRNIKRALYKNPQTGEKGLIADVAEIKRVVLQIRAGWWIIAGGVALIQFLQLIGLWNK